ncbi:MAG TPA: Wzz/FepE/Etk N-terminal domain-containing protein, partial [Acidimicrobiales bacterium]|nr:Wzz/FepE/Etk N-terminal domain-containing protein [Acidimicrobiales bacterium]
MDPGRDGELGLREYLDVLRRRKTLIVLIAVVITVPTLVISLLKTPVYAGEAEILLRPRSSETLFDPNSGTRLDPNREVQNEIRILQSEPVRAAVRSQLGSAPKVSARPDGPTDIIRVTAKSTDPQQAASLANAYTNAYIDFRRKQAVDDVLAASQQVQGKITELQKQVDAAPPGSQKDSLVQAQALFKQKLDQLQVDGAL